ncbi:MAG: glycine cleavage system transcriptional regulator GcvA [Congregibacter sp.]
MQALLGFEAAARLQSFSAAAEELAMTQSAISHQIRGLESQLDLSLFRRQGRQVELTDAGRDFLETTQRTLEVIRNGLRRLDFFVKPGSVVVSCPSAWARHWLLHHLPSLRDAHPDIEPWVVSVDGSVDVEHTETDCFIALGGGNWPGLEVVPLCEELLTPVCSPRFLESRGGAIEPADLAQLPLLHDEGWEGWTRCFEAMGLDGAAPVEGYNYSDPGLAMDAAIAGQGLALSSTTLAQHAVDAGQLVQPFSIRLSSGQAWYAIASGERIASGCERLFWEWLLAQFALAHEKN